MGTKNRLLSEIAKVNALQEELELSEPLSRLDTAASRTPKRDADLPRSRLSTAASRAASAIPNANDPGLGSGSHTIRHNARAPYATPTRRLTVRSQSVIDNTRDVGIS